MLTNQIGVQQGAQDLFPAGKGSKDLRRGKGGMQKQAHADAIEAFPQQRGQHQQVVVMQPHEVIIHAHHLYQLICKCLHSNQDRVWHDTLLLLMFSQV